MATQCFQHRRKNEQRPDLCEGPPWGTIRTKRTGLRCPLSGKDRKSSTDVQTDAIDPQATFEGGNWRPVALNILCLTITWNKVGCVDRETEGADLTRPESHPPPGRTRAKGESLMIGPCPAGRPWTPAEDAQLLALLDSKMDRPSISRKLKRTMSAIAKRRNILNKRRLVELWLKAQGK